jgi:hypothetical protein
MNVREEARRGVGLGYPNVLTGSIYLSVTILGPETAGGPSSPLSAASGHGALRLMCVTFFHTYLTE